LDTDEREALAPLPAQPRHKSWFWLRLLELGLDSPAQIVVLTEQVGIEIGLE
jgi:hypothetical protein